MTVDGRGKWLRAPVYDRLFRRVTFTDECWTWQGFTSRGYGRIWVDGRNRLVHRWAFEWLTGCIIPSNMTIDHLCFNRACVRPEHLEVVSSRDNVLRGNGITARNKRKQLCSRGHMLTEENLYIRPNGTRNCRICKRERLRDWREGYHVNH